MVKQISPYIPKVPATRRSKNLKTEKDCTNSGTVYKHIPENATIISVGADIIPAETAVSPSTKPPTIDTTIPTYLGILTLASFSISKIISVKNISVLGDSGIPLMLFSIVNRKAKGINCI